MKSYLTPEIRMGEIRFLFNTPSNRNKKIIVVEGITDKKLFQSLINCHDVLFFVADGKKELISIMKGLHCKYSEHLHAICDSDFLRLNNDLSLFDFNILMTDHHDAEMLIFSSKALNKLINEHVNDDFIFRAHDELFEICICSSYELGLLRWINDSEYLNLNFSALNFNEFVFCNGIDSYLDVDKLIDQLLIKSRSAPNWVNKSYLLEKIKEYSKRNPDVLQLCCGHDLTNILWILLKCNDVSKSNLSKSLIESSLRLAYTKSDFNQTKLAMSIYYILNKLHFLNVAA